MATTVALYFIGADSEHRDQLSGLVREIATESDCIALVAMNSLDQRQIDAIALNAAEIRCDLLGRSAVPLQL